MKPLKILVKNTVCGESSLFSFAEISEHKVEASDYKIDGMEGVVN